MSNQTDQELFSELEAAVRKQQEAASDTHEEVLRTIQDLHEALNALEEREHSRTHEAASWTDDAREQLQSVRDKVDQSVTETREAEGRLEAARARIQELENDLKSLEALAKELDSAEGKLAQLERDLAERDEAVASAEETQVRLTKMEEAYSDQAEAIEAGQAAKRRAAELDTTLEEYKTAALADRERTVELEGFIEELTRQVREYEENLAGVESSTERVAELEADHDALREQVAEAESRLAAAQEEADSGRRDAAEFEDQLTSRSAALEEAEEGQDQARRNLESLQARVCEAEEQAKALSAEAATHQKQLSKAEKHVHSLESEIEKVRVKAKKSVVAQQLAETLAELEDSHAEIEELRRQLGGGTSEEDPAESGDDGAEEEISTETDGDTVEEEARPALVRYSDSRRRMGQILVEAGVISEDQLQEALACQREEGLGRHIGAVIVSLGLAQEEVIARAVASQNDVEYFEVDPVIIDLEAVRLINVRLAEMHTCIPIRMEDGALLLAMENPLDLVAIEDIERASGLTVRPVVASVSKILDCIDALYDDSPGGK